MRFGRLVAISSDRTKDIKAIEPVVREYEEACAKVQELNDKIEKVLSEKQTPADLQTLEKDLEEAKVICIQTGYL